MAEVSELELEGCSFCCAYEIWHVGAGYTFP